MIIKADQAEKIIIALLERNDAEDFFEELNQLFFEYECDSGFHSTGELFFDHTSDKIKEIILAVLGSENRTEQFDNLLNLFTDYRLRLHRERKESA